MKKNRVLISLLLLFIFNLSFGQPVLLKDLPASAGNYISSNGKLYFTQGDSLWKSDGTAAGTVLVKKIGESSITLFSLTVGSNFFFTTTEGSGKRALWKSDGTLANTVKLASYTSVVPLLIFNNELYLSINNGTQGNELFKTSGAVPVIVQDINPGAGSGFVGDLIVSNNQLFFRANSGSGGVNIWKSNGTSAGTILAADLTFDDYEDLTDVNGTIFFARNFDGKAELYKTNGTTASTVLVKRYALNEEPFNEEATQFIDNFFSLNGKLYFHYSENFSSVPYDYLVQSDGTEAGTVTDDNIAIDGFVQLLTKALNKFVYQGNDQGFTGPLTVYNPATSTHYGIVGDPGPVSQYAEAGNLFFFAGHINGYYNSPDSIKNTFQLWQSDLVGNTIPVKSLFNGTSFPGTGNITPAGNKIFFTTQLTGTNDPIAMKKKRLWYYDPTLPVTPIPYFTVVKANTNEVIQELEMGDEIIIPTGVQINIRYNEITHPGSVVFKLADTIRRIESTAPYLLAGDNNGVYSPWLEVKEGLYKLTAIPYSQSGGKGTAENPTYVEFSVKFQNIPPVVDLGPDRTIPLPKDTVIITAKVTDPDSDNFIYFWSYEGGSTVSKQPILAENGKQLNVSNLEEGFYNFRVFVLDQEGGSAFDVVKITVTKTTEGNFQIALVNAATDQDIRLLASNDTIRYNTATDKISVRAIPNQAVGSVQFFLNGSLTRNENTAPYAIKGDINGDITTWNPAAGNYTLLVKLFTGSSGSGTLIASRTINLVVITGTTQQQAQITFTLVNAVTNQDIGPLVNGQVINLSNLPTNKLNVRANSTLPNTKSIIFAFDGNSKFRTENTAPYSLFGDSNGDYATWTAVTGAHTLKATPFTAINGGGTAGVPLEISFTIIGSSSAFKTASLKTYPNPTDEQLSVDLENFESENVTIQIYDQYGGLYYEGQHQISNGTGSYQIDLKDLNMNPGIYFVKFKSMDTNDVQVIKIIKR